MPPTYRALVEQLARDIADGRLRPGDRLLPQREFADQRGIAASTASRVYGELARRGLISGEVGRGSYVRAAARVPAPAEPAPGRVNLEINLPVLPAQAALLARSLQPLARRPSVMSAALEAAAVAGPAGARHTVAAFLERRGWSPAVDGICFTGNGKQALAAVIAALVPRGQRLGAEAITYPMVKVLASGLGVEVVPIAMDEHGLRPDALAAAHRKAPLRAVYCQPTLHNPLGMSMPAGRRAELAASLQRHDVVAIEDLVYAFLAGDEPPLAAGAPDHAVVVDSLSKRIAPGISIGYVAAPIALAPSIASAVRAGAWAASGLSMQLCLRWIADGTAATLSAAKRRDAATRQRLLRTLLRGLDVRSNPKSYHAWLLLPERWRADAYVAAAAQRGIGITPAAAFTVSPGHAPNAVRIALASPSLAELEPALGALAAIARGRPRDWDTE
ncbi:MAG: PLP-dependent aminotransferase family protein [Vicinamibacterales bacterium]